jgi:hypothetical protein
LEIKKLKKRIQEIESEVKKAKSERAARERRERSYSLPGESFGAWLSRIGGPFVKVEVLQICPKCKRPVLSKEPAFHRCSERVFRDTKKVKETQISFQKRSVRNNRRKKSVVVDGEASKGFKEWIEKLKEEREKNK